MDMEGEKTAQLGMATGRAKRRERVQKQGTRKKQENETKMHRTVQFYQPNVNSHLDLALRESVLHTDDRKGSTPPLRDLN